VGGVDEVIWARRLRPRYRWWYPVLLAVVAVVGLWIGIADAIADGDAGVTDSRDPEASPSPFLFIGAGAAVGVLVTAMAWAPHSWLTADGVLHYRAVTRRRTIDLRAEERVAFVVSGVVHGGPAYRGGHRTARHVHEVRTLAARQAHQRTTAQYLPPPGVVGIADPPPEGDERQVLLDALTRFVDVEAG
jgi:hypothetical protein